MNHAARSLCIAVLTSLALASCTPHVHAQLVVVIDSNLAPGVDYDRVHFQVQGPGGTVQHDETRLLTTAVGDAGISVPFSFGVYPANGDTTRAVTLTAEARLGSTHVVSYSAVTAYESDRALELDLFLERACVGMESTCSQGEECGRGGTCVNVTVSPMTLRSFDPDAGTDAAPPGDLGIDADAQGVDAAGDGLAPDVAPDASGPSTFLLLAVTSGTSALPYGSSYTAGFWATPTPLAATNMFPRGGGGVTVLADGRGLAVLRPNAIATAQSALWTAGSWGPMSTTGSSSASYLSDPVATATGALYARQTSGGNFWLAVDSFSNSTSGWTQGGDITTFAGASRGPPSIAVTPMGVAVLADDREGNGYAWSSETGTSWTAPSAFAGVTTPIGTNGNPTVRLVSRVGAEEIDAFIASESAGTGMPELLVQRYYATGWTGSISLATDFSNTVQLSAPMSVAALADGRFAVAYLDTANHLKVGFLNGSTPSAFQAVPGMTSSIATQGAPFSIARGADPSSAVEVVYIDLAFHLMHMRLTDERSWTWTTPAPVETAHTWSSVWTAVGP